MPPTLLPPPKEQRPQQHLDLLERYCQNMDPDSSFGKEEEKARSKKTGTFLGNTTLAHSLYYG